VKLLGLKTLLVFYGVTIVLSWKMLEASLLSITKKRATYL